MMVVVPIESSEGKNGKKGLAGEKEGGEKRTLVGELERRKTFRGDPLL